MNINERLASEFNLKQEYSDNIIALIKEGCTIPFIARYRKEMHGTCDDQVLRKFSERLTYLEELQSRKEAVQKSIESQEKWTDEIATALTAAMTMTEVEDIYRPYKKKKKTRASVAIEKGLDGLADIIMAQELLDGDLVAIAAPYVDAEKGVENIQQAYDGAKDIIAERISDNAELRKELRELLIGLGEIATVLDIEKEGHRTFEMYKEYSEKICAIPGHRILAINRGEREDCLKVSIKLDTDSAIKVINKHYIIGTSLFTEVMGQAVADSYQRLIFPSIEREGRSDLTDKANEGAIKLFEKNLEPLLLQPPLKGKRILGLDPAYRTGCKIAIIDEQGNVLLTDVVYPTPPQSKVEEALLKLTTAIEKHKVDAISIGNGTASKEAEIFVCQLIKACTRKVSYAVVSEAGASVYSASPLAAEEFPGFDVSLRSAVSIARRLQDPLAELIKIDVKSIGVGQYQHDMPEKRMNEVLGGVVESCVNSVGVDLNTASYSLLAYVSGLNGTIAKNIVKAREAKPFTKRSELLKVAKLGPKAYEQCAGFLRISGGAEVLDNTSVHPEAYNATNKLLAEFNYTEENVKDGNIADITEKAKQIGLNKLADKIGVGVPTLQDILNEIVKPGRDIRDSLPAPILRDDLMDINDLKEGMEIIGTVRNVIDFGAFVDIGVHQDGLVHISEISNDYIKHPQDALTVGDIVTVKVIGIDTTKGKISLSIKQASNAKPKSESINTDPRLRDRKEIREQKDRQSGGFNGGNNQGKNRQNGNNSRNYIDSSNQGRDRKEDNKNSAPMSMDDMLKQLQKKFNR